MASGLNDTEYLADTLSQRIDQLLTESGILKRELARKSDGTLEHDKAFIRAHQNNIITKALAREKTARLEHILLMR